MLSTLQKGKLGQSMTEVALLIPVLLLLLGISVDLARAFFMASQVTNSAREGALFAAHHAQTEKDLPTLDAETKLAVQQEEQSNYQPLNCITPANITITRSVNPTFNAYPPGGMVAGQTADETIVVTCSFTPLLGFLHVSPFVLKTTVQTTLVS